MFGTAFMALFAGMLLSKDRTSSFLMRLFASPMTAAEYLLGYTVPLIIMTAAQATITLVAAFILHLQCSVWSLLATRVTTVAAFLFIGLGLLYGSLLNDKAVGGICGALLTNLAGWLSGVFMPIDLIGGAFKTIAHILPFYRSVEAIKAALNGDLAGMLPHLGIVLAYAIAIYTVAIFAFKQKMRGGSA